MKYSELVKLLSEYGCYFFRHGSGHDIWKNPDGGQFSVPRHWGREVSIATLNKIFKQAGIKKE